ncbi:MAG: hypothetical protein JWM21_971 [Acidobacteria bacterium]|nr:hypothetical protein [Acidobacteriota bacterium]
MRFQNRKAIACLASLGLMWAGSVSAQWQKKPYQEWSEKEALKILNDSPWGQTQTVTDTSKMFDTGRTLASGESRVAEVPKTNFRIRFFSSRPIRQATSRFVELKQKGPINEQLAAQLQSLANADFPDYVIITVTTDSTDSGSQMGSAAVILDKQTTSQLKNDTYLLVSGGQRVFLREYQPPRKDGLGARFIFARTVDGKPFITPESSELLFYSKLTGGPELSMRFKIKDMLFNGKLEY